MTLFDHIRSWFAWKEYRDTGVWKYLENQITGERKAIRSNLEGYQPKIFRWLNGGEWDEPLGFGKLPSLRKRFFEQ